MQFAPKLIRAVLTLTALLDEIEGKTLCHVCTESKGIPDPSRGIVSPPAIPSNYFHVPAVKDYMKLQVDACGSWQWSWSYLANNMTFDCDTLGQDILHSLDPNTESWACIESTEWFDYEKTTGTLLRGCHAWNQAKFPNMQMNTCGELHALSEGGSDLDVCICNYTACNNVTQAFSSGTSYSGIGSFYMALLVAGVLHLL